MNIQVEKSHYNFSQYVGEERWDSYYCQIKEMLTYTKNKVLVVGVGDNIVVDFFKKLTKDISVISADFDPDLQPDICTDVRELSDKLNKNYLPDTIVCCQVLEHLPFDSFECSIIELQKSMCKDGILILSLPDSGFSIRFCASIPKIRFNYQKKYCRFWKKDFQFNGEHYWEINSAKDYSEKRIQSILLKHFKLEKTYFPALNTYHRFYVLRKK